MKTIDYQHLDQGLGIERSPSFPRELQKGMIARFQALLTGLIGPAQDQIYVIHGCEFTVTGNDYSMTAGAVFYNNRIWTVDAFQGSIALEIPVFVVDNVYDRQALYSDGSLRDTFFEQKLAVQFGAPGSGIADYNQIELLETAIARTLELAKSGRVESIINELPGNISWRVRNIPPGLWTGMIYENDIFIAVATGGTVEPVMTSPDGINWTTYPAPAGTWNDIAFGNGLYVVVASGGPDRVMTSPDAMNWTARTAALDLFWRSVAFGNGVFVAVSSSGTSQRVMTSPDGINWTARIIPVTAFWESVTFAQGLFVVVGTTGPNGRAVYSSDGVNWTLGEATTGTGWLAVTYAAGLFVAVGNSGAMSSPDGINWTIHSIPTVNIWERITYGNEMFIAMAPSGDDHRAMKSLDGKNWVIMPTPAVSNYRGLAFGAGIFVTLSPFQESITNGIPLVSSGQGGSFGQAQTPLS